MALGAEGYVLIVIENLDNPAVPELEDGWVARPNFTHVLDRVAHCQATIGKEASVPIIIAYRALLGQLKAMQVPEVQVHEPYLVTSQAHGLRADVEGAYAALAAEGVPIHLATYYDDLGAAYPWVVALPVAAVGLDFLGVPGAAEANCTLELIKTHGFTAGKRMGAGVVDGRSVWADTGLAGALLSELRTLGVSNLCIQPSAPLQHLPLDVTMELELPESLRARLGFAVQKLGELVRVAAAAGTATTLGDLASYRPKELPFEIEADKYVRSEPFNCRRDKQIAMPVFPTTSIGSFPQTADVRRLRLQYKQGRISRAEYDRGIASHTGFVIGIQESLGMDVLVHGESERTDMVEYFGQALEGMLFTQHGWVQSYGSRYVRPPLIVVQGCPGPDQASRQGHAHWSCGPSLTGPSHAVTSHAVHRPFSWPWLSGRRFAALEAAGCRVSGSRGPRWAAYLGWAVDASMLRLCARLLPRWGRGMYARIMRKVFICGRKSMTPTNLSTCLLLAWMYVAGGPSLQHPDTPRPQPVLNGGPAAAHDRELDQKDIVGDTQHQRR
eukprot:gene23424-30705_t